MTGHKPSHKSYTHNSNLQSIHLTMTIQYVADMENLLMNHDIVMWYEILICI